MACVTSTCSSSAVIAAISDSSPLKTKLEEKLSAQARDPLRNGTEFSPCFTKDSCWTPEKVFRRRGSEAPEDYVSLVSKDLSDHGSQPHKLDLEV